MILRDLVVTAAERSPAAVAVRCGDQQLTYAELNSAANRAARVLHDLGVRKGDRVGVWMEKSPRTVVAMQAALRLGAAYVPLDPLSPSARVQSILRDCQMRAVVANSERASTILTELAGVSCLVSDGEPLPGHLHWRDLDQQPDSSPVSLPVSEDDLAYILYTSGSTGIPKGVCISHLNALAFVEWAVRETGAQATDRFANHAPFHFDLSVFDLYACFLVGGEMIIIPEAAAYVAQQLVDLIRNERPTIWYSVPSALILMMQWGGLLELENVPMRVVIFAGEPFPIKHLQELQRRWPQVRLFNMYGPTETNVCTSYEVPASLEGRTRPVPIGRACSGDRVWAVREDGSDAAVGEEGELLVSGPTVMLGYWGKPPHGPGPYRTGDLVTPRSDGDYDYIGRRDHMVKIRGHRIELGDIETALLQHPKVSQACVLVCGDEERRYLQAVVVPALGEVPTLLELKKHCADRLPRYMIIDRVRIIEEMPRTRSGKADRQQLQATFGS